DQRPSARWRSRPRGAMEDASVEIDQTQQADGEPCAKDDRHPGKPRAAAQTNVSKGSLHRKSGMAEDVPEQEDEHTGGEGVEEPLDAPGQATHPADRKADEDGGT